LCGGVLVEGGEFVLKVVHPGDGLGGGVVCLLAVSAGLVAFSLRFAAAGDLFGEAGLGGSDALVGGRAGGVHLSFGGFHIASGAQLGDSAIEGVGVLSGKAFQLEDEFGGAGQADGDGRTAGREIIVIAPA
jgi:hypothetical protein